MQEKIASWLDAIRSTDFSYLAQKPYLILAGIAGGLFLLLILLRLRPRGRIRAFKGETGYVEISRHALLELVHSACEQMPEVRKPSIKIKANRKLSLSVRIRVDGSAHLRDTASFLQNHLKDSLENNLGVENLGQIEILVTGIRAGAQPKVKGPGVDLNPIRKEPVKTVPVEPTKPVVKAASTEKVEAPAPPPAPVPPPSTASSKPEPADKEFKFESKNPSSEETKPQTETPDSETSSRKDSETDKNPGPSFFEKKKKK